MLDERDAGTLERKNISWPAKKVILVMQRLHIGSDLINYVTRLLIHHFISDKCLKVGMQPIGLKKTDFEVS